MDTSNEQLQHDEILSISCIYQKEWIEQESDHTVALKLFSKNDTDESQPLIVTFELPENYPNEAKPIYTISAPWMAQTDKDQLTNIIDLQCEQYFGDCTLCLIIETIQKFLNNDLFNEEELKTKIDNSSIDIYYGKGDFPRILD